VDGTKLYMVFDVESVGLHGEGFSYGFVVVTDGGEEIAHGGGGCHPDHADGPADGRQWVADNVPAPRWGYGLPRPRKVRDQFWSSWTHWKGEGAVLAADCPWPVEARFLIACVADEPGRTWEGPYPLIDVASVRLAAGPGPLGTGERLAAELPAHDPLADARQSARLLLEALRRRES
jgi:hypothetical protein